MLFWPLVRDALGGEPRFFDWDVPEQYWPDLVRLCRDLHGSHGIPYWSPHDRGGYPYHADPQSGAYHPFHWAVCAFGGPDPSLHWATLRVLAGFAVALVGAHVWLRHTPLGRGHGESPSSHAASALGAVVFASAPFLRHNWELNLTLGLSWLPWILWAFDRLLASPGARRACGAAIAFALCAWSGSPPALWLTVTFVSGYLALRLGALARHDRAALRAVSLWMLGSAAIALLLTAVVVIPAQGLSARSVQADHTFASIVAESLDGTGLLALVTPLPGNHLFLGPVVWLATGASLWARRTRPAAFACVAAAALAVLLAMGEHTPVFGLFFEHVPGFDRFRLPHRYEAWLGPVAALATTLGADVMVARMAAAGARRTRAALAWGLGVALAGTHLALVSAQLDPHRHSRAGELPCRDARDPLFARVRESPDRVFDEFALGCRAGTRLGLRDLRGYQDPLLLHAYERVLSQLTAHPALLRQYGVRHVLSSPHFLHGWDHHYLPRPEILAALPGARTVAVDGARRVIDLGPPVPRAYVVPSASVLEVASREEALERVTRFAPSEIAVIETTLAAASRAHEEESTEPLLGPARVRVEDPDADTVVVTLAGTPAGVLVVNDVYDVGWGAEVDGRPADVRRVNALVRGVNVPRGAREVVLRFAPADGLTTRALWAIGWLLALLGLAIPFAARRSVPRGAADKPAETP
ncbi:MAG: hypothetical protein ACK6CU_02705 [Deltaproteobacteria bacterium]